MGSIFFTTDEAEQFLYEEARLLDERRFDDWLDLFSPDGVYWIPIDEDDDPRTQSSIQYDDDQARRMRVYHLVHSLNYAQHPPSITVHQVTNVQVRECRNGDEALVRSNLTVHELRRGDHRQYGLGKQQSLTAKCEHTLRFDATWKIALKKIVLINRYTPLPNLSFLL